MLFVRNIHGGTDTVTLQHLPPTWSKVSISLPKQGDIDATAFLARIEKRRQELSASLDDDHRARFGQYFTPDRAADLIAGMVCLPHDGSFNVMDPGAGIGSLTAALVARIVREQLSLKVSISAVEVDPALVPHLETTLAECRAFASANRVELTTQVIVDDLVDLATDWSRPLSARYDLVIMNPPYRKLGLSSPARRKLSLMSVDSPNLYSSFLAIGAFSLVPGGQLVAITPRSFANGPYFSPFRRFLLSQMTLTRIHVFESRGTVFADSRVLQENIVFSATRWSPPQSVQVSVSHGHTGDILMREVASEEIVRPFDKNQFIHIPTDVNDKAVANVFATLPCTIVETGVQVSTGKVVDFRARNYLLSEISEEAVPLIYPANMREGHVSWPRDIRKPQGLASNDSTRKLVLPNERYVLVKRFSAKEERRRVVAAVYEPIGGQAGVGFENHINVFHNGGRGLDRELARGLCLWLNSSLVDGFFRTFSGHTQVNATDLRSMRYPSPQQLQRLGSAAPEDWTDQPGIDALVTEHVFAESVRA